MVYHHGFLPSLHLRPWKAHLIGLAKHGLDVAKMKIFITLTKNSDQ